MKRTSIFIIMVLIVSMALTGCGGQNEAEDTWSELEDRGKIVVGLDDTFVPMGFTGKDGELTGFDVDLATEAIKRLGMDLELQAIDWNLKEQELESGNIDLIWNGYSITKEREEKVNFTSPYLDNQQIIVVLSDSDIGNRDDLKDRIVCTQNSSSALEAIEKSGDKEDFKDGDIILFDTYTEAFLDLEAGRVEAVVGDEVLVKYYIEERGKEKFKVADGDFGDEEYGVGVRKNDKTLLDKLNAVLDEMKEDGSAAEISEKWFGENIVK